MVGCYLEWLSMMISQCGSWDHNRIVYQNWSCCNPSTLIMIWVEGNFICIHNLKNTQRGKHIWQTHGSNTKCGKSWFCHECTMVLDLHFILMKQKVELERGEFLSNLIGGYYCKMNKRIFVLVGEIEQWIPYLSQGLNPPYWGRVTWVVILLYQ